MKLDKNTFAQFRIPTQGMQHFSIVTHQEQLMGTRMFDDLKQTQAFRDNGVLHSTGSQHSANVYFVQREDGYCVVIPAGASSNGYYLLKPHLDESLKAEVILCSVPAENIGRHGLGYLNEELGALEFIAQHHPSHDLRVKALIWLMGAVDA